jgi:hypothetical protein
MQPGSTKRDANPISAIRKIPRASTPKRTVSIIPFGPSAIPSRNENRGNWESGLGGRKPKATSPEAYLQFFEKIFFPPEKISV